MYKTIGVGALMITWWITEALPIFLTSLLPIILFPLLHVSSLKEATAPYANPVIFLFMGGFMIAIAMEKWQLHKRIALRIIRFSGTDANKIILGFMIATALLSMWLSNTATAVMMLPIGVSIIDLCTKDNSCSTQGQKNFGLCMMLGIAYAANIGGFATLIGTPPNLVMMAYLKDAYGIDVIFFRWMIFGIPLAFSLLYITYWLMTTVLHPNKLGNIGQSEGIIDREIEKLGSLSKAEKNVAGIFLLTACLWIFREPLTGIPGLDTLDDPIIALLGGFLLFIAPSGEADKRLLDWNDMTRLPWGILLLFGGGLSLAAGLEKAGVLELIAYQITSLGVGEGVLAMLLLTATALFLTEVMSNVALVTVFVPIVSSIALGMGKNPLYFAIPVTIAASCAFMMPMSTPPNAIVFGSGHIRMGQMAKTGLLLNVVSIILISIVAYFILPAEFNFAP